MSNKYKRRVRALAAKLNISYQAADNMIKAGRRNGSPAVGAAASDSDAAPTVAPEELRESSSPCLGAPAASLPTQEEHEPHEDLDAATKNMINRYGHPFVAAQVAGWMVLVATPALHWLLEAVVQGGAPEGIERELTRYLDRKRPMTLGHSRLPRTGAENVEALAATARLVGHEPPMTFGDLLLLLKRLGVVTEQAGRYSVAFPPPAPEEVLPLTPQQRSHVMRFRGEWTPRMNGMETLRDCVRAEGPGFVPPAWMRVVLDQQDDTDPDGDMPEYVPPGSCAIITGVEADPAFCDQLIRGFSAYLSEDPRACRCGASITKVSRYANTSADYVMIEAWCAQGHFGYMAKRVVDFCPLDLAASEASVERFLQGRPEDESIQARDFYTEYVLWGLAQKCRPVSNVMFSARVMASGRYRRTDRRPGGRTYHRLPFTNVVLAPPSS
ncbi:MAG: DUF6042 family protein [Minicystis sp.]